MVRLCISLSVGCSIHKTTGAEHADIDNRFHAAFLDCLHGSNKLLVVSVHERVRGNKGTTRKT